QTARVLSNMGIMYAEQGRYTIALPLHQEALKIREARLPNDHPLLAESLENTADSLRGLGRQAEADQLDRRARLIRGEPEEGAS
ncbi:MAG: tetratricopeptide repeat protein, partial [Kiloniellales bacterium]